MTRHTPLVLIALAALCIACESKSDDAGAKSEEGAEESTASAENETPTDPAAEPTEAPAAADEPGDEPAPEVASGPSVEACKLPRGHCIERHR